METEVHTTKTFDTSTLHYYKDYCLCLFQVMVDLVLGIVRMTAANMVTNNLNSLNSL